MMYENLAQKCNLNYSTIAKTPEKFKQGNQLGFIRVEIKRNFRSSIIKIFHSKTIF